MTPKLIEILDVFGGYENTKNIGLITSGCKNFGDDFRRDNFEALLKSLYEVKIQQSFNLYSATFNERLKNSLKIMWENDSKFLEVRACMSLSNFKETIRAFESVLGDVSDELEVDSSYPLLLGWGEDDISRGDMRRMARLINKNIAIEMLEAEALLFQQQWFVLRRNKKLILVLLQPIPFDNLGRGKNIQQASFGRFHCEVFNKEDFARVNIRPDGSVYPECGCKMSHMQLGQVGIEPFLAIAERKQLFAERLLKTILADPRMFKWGTQEDTCNRCQQLVAEYGWELSKI